LVITRACMLFFASEPLEALRLAIKAYPPISNSSPVFLLEPESASNSWKIDQTDAKELLCGLFLFKSSDADSVDEIVRSACTPLDSSASNTAQETNAVCADQLYESLCSKAHALLHCYASYEAELSRIFGRRGRPLTESRSISTSQISLSSLHNSDTPREPSDPEQEPMLWTSNQFEKRNNTPAETFIQNRSDATCSVAYRRPLQNASRQCARSTGTEIVK
uniref:Mitochondrial import inner membrane translocase subunit TIM16 n=1 Tax=Echinostoma caproni TaxID=27848 RepID=A0A183B913_9TREM